MLYYLFDYLDKIFDLPGTGVVKYLSFRAGVTAIVSLFISIWFGGKIIKYLKKKQIGETVRELGLKGQKAKEGTPTMGGIIIILAILIPILLFAKIANVYILLMIFTTIALGLVGFADDYIKVFKKNKEGLKPKWKLFGQIAVGVVVAVVLIFVDNKDLTTTIPFVKGNELNYAWLISWISPNAARYAWIIFIPIVIFIIMATSNAVNLTDGIDGLAAGTSSISAAVLGILAWISGNIVFANYLNIMYLPEVGELLVFISAFVGATLGFLWHNSHPAAIFMGDTGSLTLGGIIAVFAILIRKELLLPLLCLVFFWETISVIIQRYVFKYRRIKYGWDYANTHRVFLMTPYHHHWQKKGIPEQKIVMRFYLVSILVALLSLITLKLR
ncbi:phospho-N-acetylmuramoyl-pentapeptide-transferase [Bacteroidia bacterium]|nr:phospho-N-acetylmuramoyl-pentapeptide-transferase [Bacteroidia bacterium]